MIIVFNILHTDLSAHVLWACVQLGYDSIRFAVHSTKLVRLSRYACLCDSQYGAVCFWRLATKNHQDCKKFDATIRCFQLPEDCVLYFKFDRKRGIWSPKSIGQISSTFIRQIDLKWIIFSPTRILRGVHVFSNLNHFSFVAIVGHCSKWPRKY